MVQNNNYFLKFVNYPGILQTSGQELTEAMRQQAQNFGAEFLLATVKGINLKEPVKKNHTDKGESFQ